ncbi:MAG: hypothetical protein AB1758_29735 [Candidatus Eremiobacterota bacterium]
MNAIGHSFRTPPGTSAARGSGSAPTGSSDRVTLSPEALEEICGPQGATSRCGLARNAPDHGQAGNAPDHGPAGNLPESGRLHGVSPNPQFTPR